LINFFLSLSNPSVGLLVGIGLYLGWFINTTGMLLFLSRIVFAASFDRLVPARLSDVSERFQSPHWSIVLIGVVSFLYATLYWNYGYVATVLNTSVLVPIGFALPMVATLLFPIMKPDLYQRLFGSMKGSAALIVASLIGVFAFGFYAFAETTPLISGTYLGASLAQAYEVVLVVFVIAVLVYVAGRWNMKRLGIDPKLIFGQLPPE
jgi:amino acid transporter